MLGKESRSNVNFLLAMLPSWGRWCVWLGLPVAVGSTNPWGPEGANAAHGVAICAWFLCVQPEG